MSDNLILHTERLELRPLDSAHAATLFRFMQDERLTRFLAWAPHQDIAETQAVIDALVHAQAQGTAYHWTIFEDQTARGLISLIDIRRTHRLWTLDRAEIAYWIDVNQQSRGLATEATRAVVEAAFTHLGLNRLIISHTSSNPASGRIPVALGFRFVGTEHEFFAKGGVWFDMNHYELLSRDWRALL